MTEPRLNVRKFRSDLENCDIITSDAFDRILRATQLSPPAGPCFGRARKILQGVLHRTLVDQVKPRLTREIRSRFTAKAEELACLYREMRDEGLPLPGYFGPFMTDLEAWKQEFENADVTGRPENLVKTEFLPQALGLYAAIFQEEPTANAKFTSEGSRQYSPAAWFIDTIMSEVLTFLTSRHARDPLPQTILSAWAQPEPATMEVWIRHAKKAGTAQFEAGETYAMYQFGKQAAAENEHPAWKGWAQVYSQDIRS